MEEALFLTKFASRVTVVHRRDEFRASAIMARRVLEHEKVSVIWNAAVKSINGTDAVESVTLVDTVTGTEQTVATNGVFVAIGHLPNTALFEGQLELDAKGYIVLAGDGTTATAIPGVFAAGDVADSRYRQAVSAAGTGCMAAIDAGHVLADQTAEVPG